MKENLFRHEQKNQIEYLTDVEGLTCKVENLQILSERYEMEIPILLFGKNDTEAKNLLIFSPGIGSPTYRKKDKIHNYFSKAIKKLLDKDPSLTIATIANWPEYQENDSLLGCRVKLNTVNLNSLETKKDILKTSVDLLSARQNFDKITVIGHSTSANILIRSKNEFGDIRLIAESPSGVAKRSETLTMTENLAKKGFLKPIAELQKRIITPFVPMISNSYGLTSKEFKKDSYLLESFRAINTNTLQKEVNIEANFGEINFIVDDQINVIVGENDPMINLKNLDSRFESFKEIKNAGHLIHRQDQFLDIWAEIVLENINIQ